MVDVSLVQRVAHSREYKTHEVLMILTMIPETPVLRRYGAAAELKYVLKM